MDEMGVSLRTFTKHLNGLASDRGEKGPSHAQISRIASGKSGASDQLLSLLAEALDTPVEAFPEYRMARLKEMLNPYRNPGAAVAYLDIEDVLLRHGGDTGAAALLRELTDRI